MEKVTYKTNFLTKVIFRVDLPTLLSVQDGIKEFQAKINPIFPILEPVEQKGFVVNANSAGEVQVEHPVKINWNFRSKNRDLECNLDESSLVIAISNYVNYSSFKEVLENVMNSFFEVYGAVVTKRVGFRYINEIKLSGDLKISDSISDWLYRDDSFFNEGHLRLRGMSKFEVTLKDESKMSFSFGVFNSKYPEPVSSEEFILDYDCYTTEPIENATSLYELLAYYNEEMTAYFQKSVKQPLIDLMNKE